jgi:D-arabinose 1-dehydrogenase-like Zn-dependent alcohol dehydrogenase
MYSDCSIVRNHTIAVWGCGPVGQFAIRSAFALGTQRVIASDRYRERLRMSARFVSTTPQAVTNCFATRCTKHDASPRRHEKARRGGRERAPRQSAARAVSSRAQHV